jgi:hypothetical protein
MQDSFSCFTIYERENAKSFYLEKKVEKTI